MHKRFQQRRLTLAVLCALPFAAGAQQGLRLQTQPALSASGAAAGDEGPVYVEADRITGRTEREIEAEGTVRLRRTGQAIFSDWLRYDQLDDEVTARGNVRVEQTNDVIEGASLRFRLGPQTGEITRTVYTLRADPTPRQAPLFPPLPGELAPRSGSALGQLDARGDAQRIEFQGPGRYHVERGQYTTCGPGQDDWFIRARDLELDRNRDVGVARDATIVFKDHTIFYSPYLSFPLSDQRKSGFLAPHYESTNTTGVEFTVPYYWNIAPNRDLTLYPRYMTKRGVQLGSQFRYLEPGYTGELRAEILPSDQQIDRDRYGVFYRHAQNFRDGWYGALNINKVSDDTYFRDLSTVIAVTSQSTLAREGSLGRAGTWGGNGIYGFSTLVQSWQTLQADPLAPLTPPYNRLPQLTLTAFKPDVLKSDFDVLSSFVAFDHPTLTSGRRALAYPSLSMPLQTSYAYVTPKVGLHTTTYQVDTNTAGLQNQTRSLPILSTESGIVFERDTRLSNMNFTQTLEPRLYYLYIPYRDQSRLPNFESGLQDVNFATLYSENQFSGQDRINDANQLTLGVTSRFIHADTGVERVRFGVGQRYYFASQRVTLPGVAPRTESMSSDVLAVLSGTVARHWTAESGWQFDTNSGQNRKLNLATRYQPEPGKVLNLAYRYTAELVRQTDVSTQWPVAPGWTAVGRWNYSMRDQRALETLAGFEYNGGCWIFRLVAHRFALTTQTASTSIFLQLELNGVSRIGSNPMDILRRNIGGYTRFDPRNPQLQGNYLP